MTLSRIERSVRGLTALGTRRFLLEATTTNEVLMAAAEMKRLAGQINVVIHSLGILLCLPHILEAAARASMRWPMLICSRATNGRTAPTR
jgi:hypothetical protein